MMNFSLCNLRDVPYVLADASLKHWLYLVIAVVVLHTLINYIYNAFFHPLSKYPGPKFAAVSNIWSTYFIASGRWPWVVEDAHFKYGDIVRIGPKSLVFLEPQAVFDIHGAKRDLGTTFIKTPVMDGLGDKDDGLLFERNPEKHRKVSKTMSPAFSGLSLRAKVPTMNKYVDLTITRVYEIGLKEDGADFAIWLQRMCMDAAADLACNWEMHQVRDMKNHPFLDAMEASNFIVVSLVTAKTYPIIAPLVFLSLPWKVTRSIPTMIRELRVRAVERIRMSEEGRRSDYFEQLLASEKAAPESDRRIRHMVTVAGQFILGGYDPTSVAIYMMFFFILQHPEALELLKHEIRGTFSNYEDIDVETLRTLPWLNACLQETLRLSAPATHHALPRISPGGLVDGEYIPKGTVCRTSLFTYGRSGRFFHDPKKFRPERWVSQDHPRYDAAFAGDDHRAHFPFIMGPRQCPGREVARIMFRLIIAKMLWKFDIEQRSKKLDFEYDFRVYAMWTKPELRVRLSPVNRG